MVPEGDPCGYAGVRPRPAAPEERAEPMNASTCTHLDAIAVDMPAEADKGDAVCTACVEGGTEWVHLRRCLVCGTVACCDSSPMRHMSAHAREESHPIVTSMEPGERWRYCYVDEAVV